LQVKEHQFLDLEKEALDENVGPGKRNCVFKHVFMRVSMSYFILKTRNRLGYWREALRDRLGCWKALPPLLGFSPSSMELLPLLG